jgi:uncharacterized phiE125 gp8 family phage protein
MKWGYQRVTAPTLEPITDGEAIEHLNLSSANVQIGRLQQSIRGARGSAEEYMGRGLLTQTWKYAQDVFTDEIRLPMAAPLQTATVQYYNTSGVLTTLDASTYVVDTLSEPGRIYLAPNKVWPSLQSERQLGVEITYVVGWTDPALIPPAIIDGLYLAIGDRYEHREGLVVGTISAELSLSAMGQFALHLVSWIEPCERAA